MLDPSAAVTKGFTCTRKYQSNINMYFASWGLNGSYFNLNLSCITDVNLNYAKTSLCLYKNSTDANLNIVKKKTGIV